MEAMDGYRRAALVLASMAVQERQWYLDQLDEQDRRRISELMRSSDGLSDTAESGTEPIRDMMARTPTASIESAAVGTLEVVFAGQPEWAIALVLAHCRGSTEIERYLAQLPQAHIREIRSFSEATLALIKPKVVARVLAYFASRVEQQVRMASRAIAFDSTMG